jgi:hypothetical protein
LAYSHFVALRQNFWTASAEDEGNKQGKEIANAADG